MTIPPNSEVLRKLDALDRQIVDLKTRLPYADGQAYYNDQRKIRELEDQRYDCLQNLQQYP
ncbi:MAG: hypothetical protein ACRBB6_04405 [Neptuniibacter sp.]